MQISIPDTHASTALQMARVAAATASRVNTTRSADGTVIAFDRIGAGPAVVLVDGALCHRRMGQTQGLAQLLAPHFTVFTYDRRGRGESGDTQPYAVAREIEDLSAIVQEAGGTASVWGMSSGGALALDAANHLIGITRVAVYEAPFIVDDTRLPIADRWDLISEAIAAGRRGEAVATFLRMVGMPGYAIAIMRLTPIWAKLKSIAHTLPYDGALVRECQTGRALPTDRWAFVRIPTLVSGGGKSPAWMRNGNEALARVLPNARYHTLDGQTHMLKPSAHAPMLIDFFTG